MTNVIHVVNKHVSAYDVFIGRGSVWGNPFPLPHRYTAADRARVIERYERYLLSSPELMARLPTLRGKRLGCFCAPNPCHGDVLKKHAEAPELISAGYSHAMLATGARSWEDESALRRAFNDQWRVWGPEQVTRPVLIVGQCPDGADAMAEELWRAAGFEIMPFPADWTKHGAAAGPKRNQAMVDAVLALQEAGTAVVCTAFLDSCRKPRCQRRSPQRLISGFRGHFSHGTIDCRDRAVRAGLDVRDVINQSLPRS